MRIGWIAAKFADKSKSSDGDKSLAPRLEIGRGSPPTGTHYFKLFYQIVNVQNNEIQSQLQILIKTYSKVTSTFEMSFFQGSPPQPAMNSTDNLEKMEPI